MLWFNLASAYLQIKGEKKPKMNKNTATSLNLFPLMAGFISLR